jgi:hypothetical protein
VGVIGRGGQGQGSAEVVDPHDPAMAGQRGLDDDAAAVNAGKRGKMGGPSAEEKPYESAETVARENKLPQGHVAGMEKDMS